MKQKHYFANKNLHSQSYGFSISHVWMWELDHKEGRVPKNWYLSIVVWRRLLRVPWTATRSNQSTVKEISPEYSLEGLMLKLKLQYFGHLTQRAYSLEETQMLGKIEGKSRRGRQRMRWIWMVSLSQWTWVWASYGRWWRTMKLQFMVSQRVRHNLVMNNNNNNLCVKWLLLF